MFIPTRTAQLDNIFVGDGEYTLRLGINELIILQEKLNSGPIAIFNRLNGGDWLVQDVLETMRLALIGGGMNQHQAFNIVKTYVVEGYLFFYAPIAATALMAATHGVTDNGEVEPEVDPLETPLETDSSHGVDFSSSEEWPDTPPEK